ncbi:hypothetical protein ACHAWC_003321 [Mediolabrus comicus]
MSKDFASKVIVWRDYHTICSYIVLAKRKKTEQKTWKNKKNNTRDSNVVPHRSTNLARQCLTSLSRREAVLSLWYGRS